MDEINQRLLKLVGQDGKIKLLNLYKGLPISHPALLVDVGERTAKFRVHKYQAACLYLYRASYVEVKSLLSVFQARVESVDVKHEMAVLSGFIYADRNIGKRDLIRVQPRDPIPVEIVYNAARMRAEIADVSLDGMGVFTHLTILPRLSVGLKVSLTMRLPGDRNVITVYGKIRNLIRERMDSLRLGMITSGEVNAKSRINAYVAQRQLEIQRELQDVYQRLLIAR